MKRRNFIIGLGATAAGGTAVLGSGAFSSVEAERTVTVETANDDSAYLRLTQPTDTGEPTNDRSSNLEGQLRFQFPGLLERLEHDPPATNPENPDGLGEDALYRFARETTGEPLFRAQNQGTNPIEIHGFQRFIDGSEPDDVPEIAMFDVDTGELLTEDNWSEEIGVGEFVDLGLQIDTYGVEAREEPYNLILTIVAEATSD